MQTDTINAINDTPMTPEEPVELDQPAVSPPESSWRLAISGEMIAYIVLLALALIMRLPELGTIPLSDAEAHEALAVFHVVQPNAAGQAIIANNPLMFGVNTLISSIMGTDNGTMRISTVFVGLFLVLSPVLFRRWFGISRTLIMSLLLAVSPTLLTASRSMSGSVWAMALAILAVYCVGIFLETHTTNYGIAGAVFIALVLLTAEPAGIVTFIGLLVALFFAIYSSDEGDSEHPHRAAAMQVLREWPWLQSLLFAAVILVLVSTVFLTHTTGLSTIGESLYAGLRGLITRPDSFPIAFPLTISLFFEPALWVFGLIGAYIALSQKENFLSRFFVGWLIVSIVASFLYAGADASHSLWLTIPLAGLASLTIERMTTSIHERFWNAPWWGIWAYGLAMIVMLLVLGINVLMLARLLIQPDTTYPTGGWVPSFGVEQHVPTPLSISMPLQVIMILLVIVLMMMTFFLVGSTWGNRTAQRGVGIGLLAFLIFWGLGNGWRAAVTNASDPRDLWRPVAISRDLNLLQDSLRQISLRNTGAPYDIQITAANIPQDGAVAWALHRYLYTSFVPDINGSINTPLVVSPRSGDDKPKMGAQYVGESFPVHLTWDRGLLLYWDFIPWLVLNETRDAAQPTALDHIALWARADVYDVAPDDLTPAQPVQPNQPAQPGGNVPGNQPAVPNGPAQPNQAGVGK